MSAGWIKTYAPGEFRGRDGWHVRGRDAFGRPIEGRLPSTVKTAHAAENLARRLLRKSNSDPPAAPVEVEVAGDKPDHSFEAAARAYRRIRRPREVDWQRIERLISCKTIGPVDVAKLTTDEVATLATETMPHNSPDTLNREIVTPYSSVLHYAHELGWRDEPTIRRFIEQEDEIKAVTPEDADKIAANLDATGTYGKGAYDRKDKRVAYKAAFLEFLRLRGTRISDVLALQRTRDLDLSNARVRLTIGKARDKVRWLPLSPKLVAMFANLAPCDGVYVFPWRSKSGVYKWWTPLCKRLGIKATPHQFRHALGEEAIDAEIDIFTLQTMAGWSSLNSARRYARAGEKRQRAADEKRRQAVEESRAAASPAPANDNPAAEAELEETGEGTA